MEEGGAWGGGGRSRHCRPAYSGLSTHTVYPSGINTAFPADVQEMMLRTIPGLEAVTMVSESLL